MTQIDTNALWYLKGILNALASSQEMVEEEELCRMTGLTKDRLFEHMAALDACLAEGEPVPNVLVVDQEGAPVDLAGNAKKWWPNEVRSNHRYWSDRRRLEGKAFNKNWPRPKTPGKQPGKK